MATPAFLSGLPLAVHPALGRRSLPVCNGDKGRGAWSRRSSRVRMEVDVPLAAPRKLSYKRICEQSAEAIIAGADAGHRLLCVDFPPERSESRAGTLVFRFENNLNMCEKLLEGFGVPRDDWTSVGGQVEICDNVNPQGGGEYLTDDECLVGRRAACPRLGGKFVTVLINAGVDASTLRQVKDFDNGEDLVVLVNCALDRMSFFDKMGTGGYFEKFRSVYYLKLFMGVGMLLKCEPEPWSAFAQREFGADFVRAYEEKPQIYKVEEELRRIAR